MQVETNQIGALWGGRYRLVRALSSTPLRETFAAVDLLGEAKVGLSLLHLTPTPRHSYPGNDHLIDIVEVEASTDGVSYVVTELPDGNDLSQILRREPRLSWPRARQLGIQLCAAAQSLHSQGYCHGPLWLQDVQSSVEGEGTERFKLLSLGGLFALGQLDRVPVTGACDVPDDDQPHSVDSDVSAIVALLHRCLTGLADWYWEVPPSSPGSPAGQYAELASARLPAPGVSGAVAALLERGLSLEPTTRWSSAASLRAALENIDEAGNARPRRVTVGPPAVTADEGVRRTDVRRRRPDYSQPVTTVVLVLKALMMIGVCAVLAGILRSLQGH